MHYATHITTLVENSVYRPQLLAEHGLAFCIQRGDQTILFDTGQGGVLQANAHALNIPVDDVDVIVVSHGHYDHVGGLSLVADRQRPVDIYLAPEALTPKYVPSPTGPAREVGLPAAAREALASSSARVHLVEAPTQIAPGVTATGRVPRVTSLEETGGRFFLDAACTQPDPLPDDQALFLEVDQGIVVLLGCAHAGVISTLRYVHELSGGQSILAVVGGMHLVNASSRRIDATIRELRRLKVKQVAPAHCTGLAATSAMLAAFPRRCEPCHVGSTFSFGVE
jgi:7,8-dihydropterin-6-yl-methyl-4-(beta-D-ribofuranosyl)aminobenzene 5'-phosphate synthase